MAEGGDKKSKEKIHFKLSQKLAEYRPLSDTWDPTNSIEWDKQPPPPSSLLRIKRDLMSMYSEPPPGMFVFPEKDCMTKIHALITGPFGTPYEGGFFYFLLRFPPSYPMHPPRVKFITTSFETVRFNPNLYKNGKVCLSILGTWFGPQWSPAQCLSSVLISIQSLLCEKPFHNEPGFEKSNRGDSERYNDIIIHETLRVAVCDMLEGRGYNTFKFPTAFNDVMEKAFMEYYDYYETTAKNKTNLDGQLMADPFGEKRGRFNFTDILTRLEVIKKRLSEKNIFSKKTQPLHMTKDLEESEESDLEDLIDFMQESDNEIDDSD
ncbi:ubiquitin-conjugating enzyme E2 Ze [Chamberlinius hualienensis]